VDIVTVAMNMFVQGVDPKLDFSHINDVKHVYEKCTKMEVGPRQPYAGQLVFTAFSGSHQDAINKGIHKYRERGSKYWEVPYLPIDPADVNRQYEPIVRINSQSGKGGVAYVMDTIFGYHLPKAMQADFASDVQKISEAEGEVSPERIFDTFNKDYIENEQPLKFVSQKLIDISEDSSNDYEREAIIKLNDHGNIRIIEGYGNGPIDAAKDAFNRNGYPYMHLLDYSEHALTSGSSSKAAAYVCLRAKGTSITEWGVGVHANITTATIKAMISAMNRIYKRLDDSKLD
jgi:2-isopropylmalate synthase